MCLKLTFHLTTKYEWYDKGYHMCMFEFNEDKLGYIHFAFIFIFVEEFAHENLLELLCVRVGVHCFEFISCFVNSLCNVVKLFILGHHFCIKLVFIVHVLVFFFSF